MRLPLVIYIKKLHMLLQKKILGTYENNKYKKGWKYSYSCSSRSLASSHILFDRGSCRQRGVKA